MTLVGLNNEHYHCDDKQQVIDGSERIVGALFAVKRFVCLISGAQHFVEVEWKEDYEGVLERSVGVEGQSEAKD